MPAEAWFEDAYKAPMFIDRLLMNRHAELDILTYSLLYGSIIRCIDRQISNGSADRTTNITSDMIRIDMIGKWYREAYNDILACMDIWHDTDLGPLKHRMIKEVVDHGQCVLFHIICIYKARLTILAL